MVFTVFFLSLIKIPYSNSSPLAYKKIGRIFGKYVCMNAWKHILSMLDKRTAYGRQTFYIQKIGRSLKGFHPLHWTEKT